MSDTTDSGSQSEGGDEDRPLPPGPDGLPLLGNTHDLVLDPFRFYDRLETYGDVVRYRVAGQTFCTVLHPDHVERVFLTDAESYGKWRFEEFAFDFAPEGLLLSEGEQWRRQRTIIQRAFTPDRIDEYASAMTRYADELVESWRDGEVVAMNREASRLTLRILARSLFDLDVSGQDHLVTEFATTLNDRADTRNVSSYLPQWVPTPANRRYDRVLGEFRAFVEDLADERRDEADGDDLLSLLLSAEDERGRTMTDAEVRDQLITFLFAGHDTTSLALTYAFLLLAQHGDVRRRLDEELDAVLDGDLPTPTDVDALPYTERVIKESLRLYPPAYIVFREAREDAELGGYRIPEGTKITVPQFRLHVDERFYEDPDAFRPERWTEEFEESLPDYAFFPFGGGPRHCIGMRFAMTELLHVLPTIARRVSFDVVSDPDPKLTAGATLQPADDVELRIRKR